MDSEVGGINETTPDALLEAVRAKAGRPDARWASAPTPLAGGFWAEMWRVSIAPAEEPLVGDLVARIMPDADVGARETKVQDYLSSVGFPTPPVRLSSGPTELLNRAWMIMDLVEGTPLLADLSGPSALARIPRIGKALPEQLATSAARLHEIDPSPLAGTVLSVDDMASHISERAAAIGRTDLQSVVDWLVGERPPSSPVVVCHGDLHPFNILSGPSGDIVLDWSAAAIAPAAYELAYTKLLLENPPLVAPKPVKPMLRLAGEFLSRRFLNRYRQVSAGTIPDAELTWFSHLHHLRIVTDVAGWQANNELDQHPGHPFLDIAPRAAAGLADVSGIDIE